MTLKRLSAIFLLFLAAGVFTFYLVARHDPGLPDDAHLRAVPSAIPPDENAFTYLENAANALVWPRAQEKLLQSIASDKTWDEEVVQRLLQANAKTFSETELALKRHRLQVPSLERLANEQEIPYLSRWRKVARLYSIQSVALFRAGREKEAFDRAMELASVAHLMEDSGGPILHYMAAAAIKGAALERIRYLTARTTLPCRDLLPLIGQLDKYLANQQGISNAVKTEYRLTLKYFDELRAGRAGATNAGLSQMAFRLGARPLLNVHKTRRLFATSAENYLRSIPLPFDEMRFPERPARGRSSMIKNIVRGNMIGETLHTMTEPAWKGVLVTKCRENVSVRATQTLLALRCRQKEQGRLPDTLGELVPAYLPRIPVDDFDGKPLRYLPARKLIYSVGKDLVDAGGTRLSAAGEPRDLPFEIEF